MTSEIAYFSRLEVDRDIIVKIVYTTTS